MIDTWNPWHGCTKYSEGCANCYVYRRDAEFGKDSSVVSKTAAFNLPMRKDRLGNYKIASGAHIYACMTSDFFIDKADAWRDEAWAMIQKRSDIHFTIITKRILLAKERLPVDWNAGYENVTIGLTCENQRRADERMPAFLEFPARNKFIICEPMLEQIDLSNYLTDAIESVVAGGESGLNVRPLDYAWILALRAQCQAAGIRFHFKQTGARFIKDGKLYEIDRLHQTSQARRAGIDL